MTPTKLPACVFRAAVVNEDAEFACSCPERDPGPATLAECLGCDLRMANHFSREIAIPSLLQQAVNGAVGLAKNITGIDQASPEVITERYEICKACDQYKRWQCQKCGCPVAAKVRIASESCPILKWPRVKAKD
jgi:rubrerythrin